MTERKQIAHKIIEAAGAEIEDVIRLLYVVGVPHEEVSRRLDHADAVIDRHLERALKGTDPSLCVDRFAREACEAWIAAIREPAP